MENNHETTNQTPHEILEEAYQNLRQELSSELLLQIKNSSPGFFERLVIDLLVAMGYGGTLQDAGQSIGKAGATKGSMVSSRWTVLNWT